MRVDRVCDTIMLCTEGLFLVIFCHTLVPLQQINAPFFTL